MTNEQRLKAMRESKGLSQYKLAQLSGVTQAYISKYERGDRNVGLDALQRLCPVLGVSIAEFLAPTAIDVTTGGEILPVDKSTDKLTKIMNTLQVMDDGDLDLVQGVLEAIQAQRNQRK